MFLIIVCGSTYLKFKLLKDNQVMRSGKIEGIGIDGNCLNHEHAWEKLFQMIAPERGNIQIIAHRVVRGGEKFGKVAVINNEFLKSFADLGKSSPQVLEIMEITQNVFGQIMQLAVFDDALYLNLPEKVKRYPLSLTVSDKYSIRKVGYHGISHSFALREAQEKLGLIRTQRMIVLHLGDGSSAAAFKDGECADISSGFTVLEGLMGLARSGDFDSGAALFLIKQGMSVEELEKILTKESGLLGVSGIKGCFEDLLFLAGYKIDKENYLPPADLPKTEENIAKARLAIEMYVYRIVKYVGAYVAVLGGLDSLVLTGDIAFNSSELRNMIVSQINFLGEFEVMVVEPNEELEMKSEVEEFLAKKSAMVGS